MESYDFTGLSNSRVAFEVISNFITGDLNRTLMYCALLSEEEVSNTFSLIETFSPANTNNYSSFNSDEKFFWSAAKVAERFGGKRLNKFYMKLVYDDLSNRRLRDFKYIFNFLIDGQDKNRVTGKLIVLFIQSYRKLFLLMPAEFKVRLLKDQKVEDMSTYFSILDVPVQLSLAPSFFRKEFILQIPTMTEEQFNELVQSALSINDDRIILPIQPFLSDLYAKNQITPKLVNLCNVSIIEHRHFSESLISNVKDFIENQRIEDAAGYTSELFPPLYVLGLLLKFDSFKDNIQLIRKALHFVTPPAPFSDFTTSLANDIKLLKIIDKWTGEKHALSDLSLNSIPLFRFISVDDNFTLNQVDFLKNFRSYHLSPKDVETDFNFFAYYIALFSFLTDLNVGVIQDCIDLIDDQSTKYNLIIDLFSLFFLYDPADYSQKINEVINLMNIIHQNSRGTILNEYISKARFKMACYPKLTDLSQLFISKNDLIQITIKAKHWEFAKILIDNSNPKLEQFIDLCQVSELYYQTHNENLSLPNKENQQMFDAEVALCNLHTMVRLKKLKNSNFPYQTIIDERINSTNPLQTKIQIDTSALMCDNHLRTSNEEILNRLPLEHRAPNLNGWYDYINSYIDAGARSSQLMYTKTRNQLLDQLLSLKQYDKALIFAGYNGINFFEHVSSHFNMGDDMFSMLYKLEPLSGYVYALSTMNMEKLMQNKSTLQKIKQSKIMRRLLEKKTSSISPEKYITIDEIDDHLFQENPSKALRYLLDSQMYVPIKLLKEKLEIALCLTDKNAEAEKLYSDVTFLNSLSEIEPTLQQILTPFSRRMWIIKLIQKEDYSKARRFSQIMNDEKIFAGEIKDTIMKYIQSEKNIEKILLECSGMFNELYSSVINYYMKKPMKHFLFLKTAKSICSDFVEEKTELINYSIYFSIPNADESKYIPANQLIAKLANENKIELLVNIFKNFPKLSFMPIINVIDNKLKSIVVILDSPASFPLLLPILVQFHEILDIYSPLLKCVKDFVELFIPYIDIFKSFLLINCEEHEMLLTQILCSFIYLCKKLNNLDNQNIKIIENIENLQLMRVFGTYSFYSRFKYEYTISSFYRKNMVTELYNLCISLDLFEYAKKLTIKPYLDPSKIEMHRKRCALQLHLFHKAKDCPSVLLPCITWPQCYDTQWILSKPRKYLTKPFFKIAMRYIREQKSAIAHTLILDWRSSFEFSNQILEFYSTNGMFNEAIVELVGHKCEKKSFVKSIIPSSISNFQMLLDAMPLFSDLRPYTEELKAWSIKKGLNYINFHASVILGEYQDAVNIIIDQYIREESQKARKKILEYAFKYFPPNIRETHILSLQQEFNALFKEKNKLAKSKKISIGPNIHLFGDSIHLTLVQLYLSKMYKFAVKLIEDLEIEPEPSLTKYIDTNPPPRKMKKFIDQLKESMQSKIVLQKWLTSFFQVLSSNPKTCKSTLHLIEKNIDDPIFHCQLLIDHKFLKEAKIFAKKNQLANFLSILP